jgi:UDP-glucose 4-epimerase
MSWLVTGGAGYIGAHIVRHLVASGREVVVLDDLSSGHREFVTGGVRLVEGSVVTAE